MRKGEGGGKEVKRTQLERKKEDGELELMKKELKKWKRMKRTR
jgi:hypothetical protein